MEKSPGKELNEMEATKLPDAEFKTMVIRMFEDLRGTIDDLNENLNEEAVSSKRDIETIKRISQKGKISEIKNTLEGINSRLDESEDSISDLKDKIRVRIQAEHKKKIIFLNEENLMDLCANIKLNNIYIFRGSRRRRE